MHICSQLKTLRSTLNLSQDRFGKRLGMSGKSISAYETGRCVPTVRVLKHIATEFNIDFTEVSNETRKHLTETLIDLEESLTQLKSGLIKILSL